MLQVRLCWNDDVRRLKAESERGSSWAPASEDLLNYYEAMVQAGNTVFGPGTHWLEQRQASDVSPSPEKEVQQVIAESMQAWTDSAMKRHLSYFTESAILVSATGRCVRGHAALHEAFKDERKAMPALSMRVLVQEIIHPTPDSAVVMMMGELTHSGLPEPQAWASTQTVVRDAAGWKIATMQVYHPERGG
jgi:uncharacterized protein (TIGR02246 family)